MITSSSLADAVVVVVAFPSFQIVMLWMTDYFRKFSAWIQIAGVLAGSEELCAHISNDCSSLPKLQMSFVGYSKCGLVRLLGVGKIILRPAPLLSASAFKTWDSSNRIIALHYVGVGVGVGVCMIYYL